MVIARSAEPNEKRFDRGAVSVIVPVFQEVDNIEGLVRALDAVLTTADFQWELLLIDDRSRDGSGAAARSLEREFPVRFEVRMARSRDLSRSVLQGMRSARFERVVVMDADLSHPPEKIPDPLQALQECEMAVGSRYVMDGSLDPNWSPGRRLISTVATWLAAPLVQCSDPLSGFFAVERSRVPELDSLRPLGFKIGLELMVRGQLSVCEIPIVFNDRRKGASKLNLREQLKFLRHLSRLYRVCFPQVSRLICFGLVGASGFVVDVLCWQGLQWFGVEHRWARFFSFWPAVSWNWSWNRAITFHDRVRSSIYLQWMQFIGASLIGLLTNVGTYLALTGAIPFFDENRLLAIIGGVLVGMTANFAVADRFVFRRNRSKRGSP